MNILTASSSTAEVVRLRSKPNHESFVRLGHELLRSPAWQSLPVAARALYVEIAARYNGRNNGRIAFSVRDAKEALHLGQRTIYRAFNALQGRGLIICHIVCRKDGLPAVREWELTDHDWDGMPATRAFLTWRRTE